MHSLTFISKCIYGTIKKELSTYQGIVHNDYNRTALGVITIYIHGSFVSNYHFMGMFLRWLV